MSKRINLTKCFDCYLVVDVVVHAVLFGELFDAFAQVQRVERLQQRLLVHLSRDLLAKIHVVRVGQHGHRLEELV